ncbi:DUF3800 domain-containing protein [Microbispora sp. H10949]|uniref:DUF3800 domain-containing protein n=1 Tax=Microbispora sp. H10949 TaxID=2729111 RepID=UPI001C729691|nr:DUF3800 domain-containing protein [Microbispora sp. H10949]
MYRVLSPPAIADEERWTAFIDESESNSALDPDVYILAAVLVCTEAIPSIRSRMAALHVRGERKLHWVKESARRRAEIISVLEDLDVLFVFVVHEGDPTAKSERRRRKCFERLLWELSKAGVAEIVIESREDTQNKRDRALLGALLARHRIPRRPWIQHVAGAVEPLLWIADCAAGALVAYRCDDPGYFKRLSEAAEIHRIGG